MPNVHTLRDIENRGVVEGPLSKHTSSGNRLGSIRESELEKALRGNIKTASDIANDYKDLQDIYLERVKDFNHKVMELDKKLAKEDIIEVLQKVISEKDHHLQDANARLEKALSEKDSLLHEANTRIKKHLASFEKKTSPDSFETPQVIGGTDISNTTLALPHLRSITGPEAISAGNLTPYNEEKNIPNYKIPLNRNQGYAFPI
ncbi:hypothetical protein RhiirA1_476218 [Rhizophagus irregularis]|uniref:Uncharacterized protein n=1 Tax=Rhizophagus irregularis TaxID=588596 RepID=A0A2N0QVH3_9GLOM|nr:hypothetical protein RhiirA1_476218 [Rhizophagus irregularis]